MSLEESLYGKYAYLATQYASKITLPECYLEKEDIIQELHVKLFLSVKKWVANHKQYLKTKVQKPMPIEYYLRTCLNNKVCDLLKQLQATTNHQKLNDIDVGYVSTLQDDSCIDWGNKKMVLNGVDLLEGLHNNKHRNCFILFLKGYNFKAIKTLYPHVPVNNVVNKHLKKLQSNSNLLEYRQFTLTQRTNFDNENN